MEMLNRAIEDARDFEEFKRRMQEKIPPLIEATKTTVSPKRPDENREQYRARLRAEAKTQENSNGR